MGVPSTQIIALWIRDGITNTEFLLLEEVAFALLREHLPKYSEDNIWEIIEDKLQHIAAILRTDNAECKADGVPLRFEIDDEQSPYIKAFPAESMKAHSLPSFGGLTPSSSRTYVRGYS